MGLKLIKGEFDIIFRIGQVELTFPFLVSNALSQKIKLGYNFSKVFHIGPTWKKSDQMCFTMKGHIKTTRVSTTAVSALVQCAENITIQPYTKTFIK